MRFSPRLLLTRLRRPGSFPALVIVVLATVAGCSGSKAVVQPPVEVVDEGSSPFTAGSFLHVDADSTALVDLAAGTRIGIAAGGSLAFASTSPSKRFAVFATSGSATSRLYLVDRTSAASRLLHEGAPDLVWSAVWSPDGTELAFGFYVPGLANDRPAQGAGDILVVDLASGSAERLGCSASRQVILWSNPDQIVVRGTDEMYRVRRRGCGTLQTVDIQRWHQILPAPVGSRMAYIFRELAFNRESRTYEPDSALFVAGTAGAGGIKVVGDRYRPRHMAWSPDGSELAFDVLVSPDDDRRAVAAYDVETTKTVYASPPTDSRPSESRPVWDPTGTQLSFLMDGHSLFVRASGMAAGKTVSLGGRTASGLLGWLTDTTMLVRDEAGTVWLYDVSSERSERVGDGAVVAF